jgi:hypothetical protein
LQNISTESTAGGVSSSDTLFINSFPARKPVSKPSIGPKPLIVNLNTLLCLRLFARLISNHGVHLQPDQVRARPAKDIEIEVRCRDFTRLLCLEPETERTIQVLPKLFLFINRRNPNNPLGAQIDLGARGPDANTEILVGRPQFSKIFGAIR